MELLEREALLSELSGLLDDARGGEGRLALRYKLPAFWALHAWIWQRNPSPFGGSFAAWNPRVSC